MQLAPPERTYHTGNLPNVSAQVNSGDLRPCFPLPARCRGRTAWRLGCLSLEDALPPSFRPVDPSSSDCHLEHLCCASGGAQCHPAPPCKMGLAPAPVQGLLGCFALGLCWVLGLLRQGFLGSACSSLLPFNCAFMAWKLSFLLSTVLVLKALLLRWMLTLLTFALCRSLLMDVTLTALLPFPAPFKLITFTSAPLILFLTFLRVGLGIWSLVLGIFVLAVCGI